MKNAARRTVHKPKPKEHGGANAVSDTGSDTRGTLKLLSDAVRRSFKGVQSSKINFKKMKLDKALEKGIEALRPDEEVMALMPTKEFMIPHGPKRTVLYWLCGDVEITVKINDYLEGEP